MSYNYVTHDTLRQATSPDAAILPTGRVTVAALPGADQLEPSGMDPFHFVQEIVRVSTGRAANRIRIESYSGFQGDSVYLRGPLPVGLYRHATKKYVLRRGFRDPYPNFVCGVNPRFELAWIVGRHPRAALLQISLSQLDFILRKLELASRR